MKIKHEVVFSSPGTFFHEETRKEISKADPRMAAAMAKTITERYGATPFGFRFITQKVAEPIEREGVTYRADPIPVEETGTFYLGGRLRTVDEIRAEANPKESILLSNMECNAWPVVVENTNSWKSIQPFLEKDVLLDCDGNEIERGDSQRLREYRTAAKSKG